MRSPVEKKCNDAELPLLLFQLSVLLSHGVTYMSPKTRPDSGPVSCSGISTWSTKSHEEEPLCCWALI